MHETASHYFLVSSSSHFLYPFLIKQILVVVVEEEEEEEGDEEFLRSLPQPILGIEPLHPLFSIYCIGLKQILLKD